VIEAPTTYTTAVPASRIRPDPSKIRSFARCSFDFCRALKEQSISTSMASIAVCGGVNNDSTICFIIKLNGGLKSPVISRRAFLHCGGLFLSLPKSIQLPAETLPFYPSRFQDCRRFPMLQPFNIVNLL
jgi:hypothetical protein